jgi:hypothetical protein
MNWMLLLNAPAEYLSKMMIGMREVQGLTRQMKVVAVLVESVVELNVRRTRIETGRTLVGFDPPAQREFAY